MKRSQKHRLAMESLENRQMLTSAIGYSYDDVGNLLSEIDDSSVAEMRDTGGDLDIYVTNGPGTASTDGGGIANNRNQLWGDWF